MIIQCGMTDLDVLEKLKSYVGGNIYKATNRNPTKWKDSWVWTITGDKAENLALSILPYMGDRRSTKINELIAARKNRRDTIASFNNDADIAAKLYIETKKSLRQIQRETGVNRQTILRHKNKLEM